MKFLADESVDTPLVHFLREQGYDVISIQETSPGIIDDLVLAKANEYQAILITADKDFGELVFRLRHLSTGIILTRLAGLTREEKQHLVLDFLEQYSMKLEASFTVITPSLVRIRPFPYV